MPLTTVGDRILSRMKQLYGPKKGRTVFHKMEAEGKLTPKAFVKKKHRRSTKRKRAR